MNLTNFILTIIFALIYCRSIVAQHQIIYNVPANRTIITIENGETPVGSDRQMYISINGDIVTSLPPYWIKWSRSENSMQQNPHYGLLYGSTCYNGQGGFNWSLTYNFEKSKTDSNFIITRYDWISCVWGEAWYGNILTYNSGLNNSFLSEVGMFDFEIDDVNDNLIYGVGSTYLMPCKFWISTDRGDNWNSFEIPEMNFFERPLIKINPLNRSNLVVASDKLWKSYDSGLTLNLTTALPISTKGLIYDFADTSIYVYNSTNGIYKATNGGQNFFHCSAIRCNVLVINPDDHNDLYAGTDVGLFRSTNGGIEWQMFYNNFTNSNGIIGIVKYSNDGDTVFAANQYSVFKIWQSLVHSNMEGNTSPKNFSLNQNYPNPFNPKTKIKFDVPSNVKGQTSNVNLTVYDTRGKEVAVLVDENLSAGSYEVEFTARAGGDGSDFPSGVYFYKLVVNGANPLTAGSFSETKRMVLLK